jgi:3-dehydro-L-gulonate 2-dehydrogenase
LWRSINPQDSETSLDDVLTHGVNRFPRFIRQIRAGYINVAAEPTRIAGFAGLEQWDRNLGPGNLNARICTARVVHLAREHGIACLALRNTNHWMRGGTYGWQAAGAGVVLIAWTNTLPSLPPWGARDSRLGNNPLVIAVPRSSGPPVVLDMAASQFSYGRLEMLARLGEQLPFPGGYDPEGRPTRDPGAILVSRRALPIGYWKGAGLALALDLLATILSGGQACHEIGRQDEEYGLSQIFIAIDPAHLSDPDWTTRAADAILADLHAAQPAEEGMAIRYPGERVLAIRQEHLERGIPVDEPLWREVQGLGAA